MPGMTAVADLGVAMLIAAIARMCYSIFFSVKSHHRRFAVRVLGVDLPQHVGDGQV